MKKLIKLKILNRFLVIKQKKIETKRISFTRRKLVDFFRRYEELKYIHACARARAHAHTHTHTHTHTPIHPPTKTILQSGKLLFLDQIFDLGGDSFD